MTTHLDYECPACGEWIEIFGSTPEEFDCPWCKTPLLINYDAEFVNGSWRNLTRINRREKAP